MPAVSNALTRSGKVDWAGITDPHTTQIVPCTLAAMRGHGDGTFGPDLLFAIQAGNVCNGIFTADLAGDGKSSVAFLGDAVGSTHIITTKDGKTFAETQTLGPPCFSAADFTGDGRPEFLCAGTPKGTTQVAFQVALNDGNGVLTLGSDAFLPDGFLADRITFVRTAPPPSPQVAVFRNANAVSAPLLGKVSNGALTFSVSSLPPKIVAAVDIFSAGHSHLIDAAGAIWDVSSDLANATAVGSVGPLGFDATVDFADVDGDGRLDILAEDLLGSSAVIYRQNPDKTFAQVWSGTGYLRFADVNGDGRPDLVNRPDVTNIRVALNTSH